MKKIDELHGNPIMHADGRLHAYGYLILTFLLWGSLYVVSRVMLDSLPLFVLAFFRFLIAGLFLLLISRLRDARHPSRTTQDAQNASPAMPDTRHPSRTAEPSRSAASASAAASSRPADAPAANGDRPGDPSPQTQAAARQMTLRYSLLLGIAGYAVFVGMQLIGTAYAGSTTASLINALNPVSITLMAALILGERLTPARLAGIFLAIAGVWMIVGTTGSVHPLGVLFSVGSVLGWSFVSVMMRKGLRVCDPLIVTRNALGIAAVCNLCFAAVQLALHGADSIFPLSAATVAGVCYMGICSTGIAYILWNKSLAILPASSCSAFYPLQPLTSAILGVVFLHETLPRLFVPGTLLILCGILICLFAPASLHARRAG